MNILAAYFSWFFIKMRSGSGLGISRSQNQMTGGKKHDWNIPNSIFNSTGQRTSFTYHLPATEHLLCADYDFSLLFDSVGIISVMVSVIANDKAGPSVAKAKTFF